MREQDLLKKWLDVNIKDWGSTTSPEYKEFERNYKNVLRTVGIKNGFVLHSFSNNHYDFSAILKSEITNQFFYVSISDVRYFKNEWANNILYRTMEHDRDYTGGCNRYSSLENLFENLVELDKQIKQNLEKENQDKVINQVEHKNLKYEDFDTKSA